MNRPLSTDNPRGTFHGAVLSLCARWRHLFPFQANMYVQSLTLSSMAQEKANNTQTSSKMYNINKYSTSSDIILLRSNSVLGKLLLQQHPAPGVSIGAYGSKCNDTCIWESMPACAKKQPRIKQKYPTKFTIFMNILILLFRTVTSHC